MAKEHEIDYLSRLDGAGRDHALGKPWSDPARGRYLAEVGGMISLMPQPPARLLDMGAGTGWTSSLFALSGYDVTAADIAPDMVAAHAQTAARYGVALASVVCDFESVPFADEFDVVVFYDCLHHAENEVAALRNAHRALRAGGVCITLEPGRGHKDSDESLRAMREFGTTERDMPPRTIIAAAKAVGFTGHAVYERPVEPMLITTGRWSSPNSIVSAAKRFLGRATPMALSRSQLVVLRK
ncbi:MAG: class I SAM-dependent methyltransferase [Ilumatobacteraceae bacterium]